ncbi:hypothetical protein PROFUN_13380 [Planoprotostelium fungivorum]|uniref:BCD1 alpha/beta domain-containing protein n=1 Tax=Planoprotostelium fungivorum TaxID=1890364 RepID=A0A2P6MZU0_9EUKA|nr:hypothetical protein PROFUN_13380 [Planoprotostelium fungivorum]
MSFSAESLGFSIKQNQHGKGNQKTDVDPILAMNEEHKKQLQQQAKESDSTKKRPRREERCEVCQTEAYKYRCPGCEHKVEKQCDGVRKVNHYIPLKQFTDNNIIDDYTFLESVNRAVVKVGDDHVPFRMKQLKIQCLKRGIFLHLMPKDMTKRKKNTTLYESSRQRMLWKIQWIFVAINVKTVTPKAEETATLSKLLNDQFEDITIRHHLREYIRDPDSLCVLMQREFTKERQFYLFNTNDNLMQCLKSKNVIEHPTLLVIMRDELKNYELIEGPEEEVKPVEDEPPKEIEE